MGMSSCRVGQRNSLDMGLIRQKKFLVAGGVGGPGTQWFLCG